MFRLPNSSSVPPTVAVTANTTLSTGTNTGDAVTRIAAAAGVQITLNTSRAPTTCTDIATVRPSSNMNRGDSNRTGTPRASASSGSALANVNGRQMANSATTTIADVTTSAVSFGVSTAAICPNSRPNLFAARPLYSVRNSTPRPSPNGISTRMMELRSRARVPSAPISSAATIEPVIAPATTLAPASRKPAAPANDNSLVPWTANGRSRIITNVLIRPPSTPSTAPA